MPNPLHSWASHTTAMGLVLKPSIGPNYDIKILLSLPWKPTAVNEGRQGRSNIKSPDLRVCYTHVARALGEIIYSAGRRPSLTACGSCRQWSTLNRANNNGLTSFSLLLLNVIIIDKWLLLLLFPYQKFFSFLTVPAVKLLLWIDTQPFYQTLIIVSSDPTAMKPKVVLSLLFTLIATVSVASCQKLCQFRNSITEPLPNRWNFIESFSLQRCFHVENFGHFPNSKIMLQQCSYG